LSIERWRKEIDAIDEQLVRLLNERSKCAIELGRIKRESGLPIYSPDREKDVIQHVIGVNRGPLDAAAMRRLFERIIDESRSIERVIIEREEGQQEQASQRKNANRKKKTR
jgi:chorismate mutase